MNEFNELRTYVSNMVIEVLSNLILDRGEQLIKVGGVLKRTTIDGTFAVTEKFRADTAKRCIVNSTSFPRSLRVRDGGGRGINDGSSRGCN